MSRASKLFLRHVAFVCLYSSYSSGTSRSYAYTQAIFQAHHVRMPILRIFVKARHVHMPILKLFLRHVTFICLYSSYLSGHVTFVCLYSGYLSRHVHQSTHLSLTRKHIHTLMHRQPHTGQAAPHKHKHIHTHTHVDMRLHTQAHTHLSQHKAQLIHIFQAETTAAQVQQHHISTVQLNRFNGLVLLFIVIP